MLTKKTIAFIGAGNLAEALIKGLISSSVASAGQIAVSDCVASRLEHVTGTYEVKAFSKNFEAAANADIILLTVKPKDAAHVVMEIAPELNPKKLIISAMAGVTTSAISDWAAQVNKGRLQPPVIRAMPNTPVIVRQGMTALYSGEGVKPDQMKLARAVFEAVGKVVVIEDESMMDAVTGLSGSGPAYIFLVMEAMTSAGVSLGLSQSDAKTLAVQTVLGAAALSDQSAQTLHELRRMVASPGGTTMEGLKKLEEGGLEAVIKAAVKAAAERSAEISKEVSKAAAPAKGRGA